MLINILFLIGSLTCGVFGFFFTLETLLTFDSFPLIQPTYDSPIIPLTILLLLMLLYILAGWYLLHKNKKNILFSCILITFLSFIGTPIFMSWFGI